MIERTNRTYTDIYIYIYIYILQGYPSEKNFKNRAIIVNLICKIFLPGFPLAFKKGPFRNNRPKKIKF